MFVIFFLKSKFESILKGKEKSLCSFSVSIIVTYHLFLGFSYFFFFTNMLPLLRIKVQSVKSY